MQNAVIPLLFLLRGAILIASEEENGVRDPRSIVTRALARPNLMGVTGRGFSAKANPKGEGVFVYDPHTRFAGVERFLIWVVVGNSAYPLNAPSKMLTPALKWPREADPTIWKATGLDPHFSREAIDIVFGTQTSFV